MIRELLRASIWCLFVALVMNLAFTSSTPGNPTGTNRAWLRVERHGESNYNRPDSTVIYSAFRPQVKQIAEKRWEITFCR